MKFSYHFLALVCAYSTVHAAGVNYQIEHKSNLESRVAITFASEPDERLYKESLVLTADHPGITISKPTADHELQQWPGKKINDAQRGWQGPVTLTVDVLRADESTASDAHMHVGYSTNKYSSTQEKIIPLTFAGVHTAQATSHAAQIQEDEHLPAPVALKQETQSSKWPSISSYVKGLLKSTESPWVRLLLVFLLGVLMSLTPCIYPMIPITIGILQSQAGDSTRGNALRALAYTLGMGITYALFGLLASVTGPMCGYIFSQPIFVVALAALLMYFGLCMFGVFEMYIPRFMQIQRTNQGGGSLMAAFLFGMASGTLASPCVSPGLALILSIVATLGNKVLGFALLFAFGVGLSMPLMIVGLSAGSLHLLPRAGMWMVEVKKLFGFLLFGLSFYYLSAILPHEITLWLIAAFLLASGLYYVYHSYKAFTPFWKKFNSLLGMGLVAAAVAVGSQALQSRFIDETCTVRNIWLYDYQEARERAIAQNKMLFIDVWADFCSICITINKTLLSDEKVMHELENSFVPLKVNGTQPSSQPYATIFNQFAITGFPTYMVVNPKTNQVIKRWDSKIYKMDPERFVTKLRKMIA